MNGKYGNSLGAVVESDIHAFEHHRAVGGGHAAVQCSHIVLVAYILHRTVGNEAGIARIEGMVNHREHDVEIPFAPVLAHHA